jgi:membrane dipeptidase
MSILHDDNIIIDGLIISKWSRSVFEAMRDGGLTAANCTCCVWDDFRGVMNNIAQWKQWFAEHDDLLLPVHTTDDIRRAKAEGKVGIILGWQNTSGIEDQIGFLKIFKDLGVGVMQLTYNTQNLSGSGCWETVDTGLSGFGREVIDEMNRVGILLDLSHVGLKTSEDAILYSKKPVAFTHCVPTGLLDFPRNKPDDLLRLIVDRGGFVGFASYPPFLPTAAATTVDDCVEAMEYLINLLGEDNVGIGTDFTQDQGDDFFEYLRHDKGYARRLVPKGVGDIPTTAKGLKKISDFPNYTDAMVRRGWPESRIVKILGENWMRVLKEAWGA